MFSKSLVRICVYCAVMSAAHCLSACVKPPAVEVPAPAASDANLALTPSATADGAAPMVSVRPSTPTTAPPSCAPHERPFGTACCSSPHTGEGRRRRFPGQQILTCHGPRIGIPCSKKSDCDIACACPSSEVAPPHARERDDLPDGTTGLVGRCAGANYVGTWMCRLDEEGRVSHMIID